MHKCSYLNVAAMERAAPIQRAIMEGDKNTGISLMKTVKELDKGPFIFLKNTH